MWWFKIYLFNFQDKVAFILGYRNRFRWVTESEWCLANNTQSDKNDIMSNIIIKKVSLQHTSHIPIDDLCYYFTTWSGRLYINISLNKRNNFSELLKCLHYGKNRRNYGSSIIHSLLGKDAGYGSKEYSLQSQTDWAWCLVLFLFVEPWTTNLSRFAHATATTIVPTT